MANVGEILVGDYLRMCKGCDFIDYNVYTRDAQGEIDVVGIDNKIPRVYICEVAIHLTTGLQYTKNKRPDTCERLTAKFMKDIDYAEKYFPGYKKEFMLWSPIVKDAKGKIEYNQRDHLQRMVKEIQLRKQVTVQLIVNKEFHQAFMELKIYAAKTSEELKSPVLRLLQIEAWLEKHIKRTSVRDAK
ncbi:MAG TPA: hypothetical protein VGO73_10615 [Pyrinomonadaceae bacterium]|jgi:hypothetical protein|nr:hypothetical protein [Pyrinomonadaceae bacterium]